MFRDAAKFNQDTSKWKTAAATAMESMFRGASLFNADLSKWQTSLVESVSYMFMGANEFNGDVSGWDVRRMLKMKYFAKDSAFNVDISNWIVSKLGTVQPGGSWYLTNCATTTCWMKDAVVGAFTSSNLSSGNGIKIAQVTHQHELELFPATTVASHTDTRTRQRHT